LQRRADEARKKLENQGTPSPGGAPPAPQSQAAPAPQAGKTQ
jgi:hypothetical protein